MSLHWSFINFLHCLAHTFSLWDQCFFSFFCQIHLPIWQFAHTVNGQPACAECFVAVATFSTVVSIPYEINWAQGRVIGSRLRQVQLLQFSYALCSQWPQQLYNLQRFNVTITDCAIRSGLPTLYFLFNEAHAESTHYTTGFISTAAIIFTYLSITGVDIYVRT